ncbi:uncharacterized protein TNCV_1221861 [Trichonephila clavipes]|nr:uncharacterized protein TNCV_1221861 [Trichonephila clavipes]
MYKNLSWKPPVSTSINELTAVPLFRLSIGTAITHHCMEEMFSRYEPEWSLLSGLEAATYIQNYLRALMDAIPNESYTYLCFLSFICHLCVQAIRTERFLCAPGHKGEERVSDGYEWRCRNQSKDNRHDVVRSVRKGTWFSESKLAIIIILRLTRYWFGKSMNAFVVNDLKVNKNRSQVGG